MPIRYTQGEIRQLLNKMGFVKARKKGTIYIGIGYDGQKRTVKFDYHKDSDYLKIGTLKQISISLGFISLEEMKKFIDNGYKKRFEN